MVIIMNKPKKFFDDRIKLTAYGAAGEVGKSAFIIEDDSRKILIDAGIKIQPKDALSLGPNGLKKRANELDAVILSHAHMDHSGYLPTLWEHGYHGKLYMTKPTKDIVQLLWQDHMKIEGERHWTPVGLDRATHNIETMMYREKREVAPGVTIEFFNAGHILGAAMVLIDWDGFKILYTGDINDAQTPLYDGFDIPDCEVDVLITETTNGLRKVQPRSEVNTQLINEVLDTLDKGHKVIIPSFALGRSQEILTVLSEHITEYPIYIDGMINKMNTITEKYLVKNWVDDDILRRLKREKTYTPFKYSNLIAITRDNVNHPQSFRDFIGKSDEPLVIVTTSGMMEPSPLHTHLKFIAGDPNNLIAITGYQAEGTMGREILEGAREVTIIPGWKAKPLKIKLKARIKTFGFSGHTSVEGIKILVDAVKPQQIYLIHGEMENQNQIAGYISNGVTPKSLVEHEFEVLAKLPRS